MRVYLFVCCFFPQGWSYRPSGPRMLREGSFWREYKVLVLFLSDQKNLRVPRPPPTLIIFPKSTDQNSEIAILFSVVEKPYNYVFWDDLLPPTQSPWEGLQVTNFDKCLHIVMVVGKCTYVFRGIFWLGGGVKKRGICWGNFPSRNLSWGKNFHKGSAGFSSII